MKMFFAVIMAVMLIGGMGGVDGDVHAVDFSGYAKIGYPAESEVKHDEINLRIHTDYIIKSQVSAKIDNANFYLGFDEVEDISQRYTFGAEYHFSGTPFFVFAEYVRNDMKVGLPDNEYAWGGAGARFGK